MSANAEDVAITDVFGFFNGKTLDATVDMRLANELFLRDPYVSDHSTNFEFRGRVFAPKRGSMYSFLKDFHRDQRRCRRNAIIAVMLFVLLGFASGSPST